MKEATIYYAEDGSAFADPRKCILYEKIMQNIDALQQENSRQHGSMCIDLLKGFLLESDLGEERLQKFLAMVYVVTLVGQGINELKDALGDLYVPGSIQSDWKNEYGGIAGEIISLPIDATLEDVCKLLRKYDSERLSLVLETLEDSPIPLRTYKLVRKYLC